MKFRKATSKDTKGIANVLVKSYNIKDLKEGINVFKNETKKFHNYIVATDREEITGLVTWVVHGLPKHQLCELDRIAVLPKYQGKGIGKKLFDALVNDAKKYYKKNRTQILEKARKYYQKNKA